jgi:hypothetical protein
MILLLLVAIAVAAFSLRAAKQARDEYDDLLLEWVQLRMQYRNEKERWQWLDQQLAAQEHIRRQASQVHRAARAAMYDAVINPSTNPTPNGAAEARRTARQPSR